MKPGPANRSGVPYRPQMHRFVRETLQHPCNPAAEKAGYFTDTLPMSAAINSIYAVILAGGRSRRMHVPDKYFLAWRGRTLLDHCIDRIRPQVGRVILSVNGESTRFSRFGLPVIEDQPIPYSGPLAGIISAMDWCRERDNAPGWLVSVAPDTPGFPLNLVERLAAAASDRNPAVVYACSDGGHHFTFALWSLQSYDRLQALYSSGERSLKRAVHTLPHTSVLWEEKADPFHNLNTPHDWLRFNELNP